MALFLGFSCKLGFDIEEVVQDGSVIGVMLWDGYALEAL